MGGVLLEGLRRGRRRQPLVNVDGFFESFFTLNNNF
jgi:hypothetical protein